VLVSVIIPAYDREGLIGRAVDSVLAQEGATVECIVVDDGSRDRTPEVLAAYGERIRAFRQDNAGRSAARNRGLAEAAGEFVCFLDSDDCFAPTKIAQQLAFHEGQPDCGLSGHGIVVVEDDGSELDKAPRVDLAELSRDPYGTVMDHFFLFPSVVMVKTALARDIGGFNTSYNGAEDLDFALEAARRGAVGMFPDCLTRMYQHGGQTGKRQLATENARVLERHLQDYEFSAPMQQKIRAKIARYYLSVAKREPNPAARHKLLDKAAAVHPMIRLKPSYLKLRWKARLGG